jgi:hypothetical protein
VPKRHASVSHQRWRSGFFSGEALRSPLVIPVLVPGDGIGIISRFEVRHRENPSGACKQAVGTALNNRSARATDCPARNNRQPTETRLRGRSKPASHWSPPAQPAPNWPRRLGPKSSGTISLASRRSPWRIHASASALQVAARAASGCVSAHSIESISSAAAADGLKGASSARTPSR